MEKREGFIERVLHGIERRIDEAHERRRAREAELDRSGGGLWTQAAERERLLVQTVSEEEERQRSLEEIVKDHRVAFVVHSEEAGRALQEFAGNRLVSVIPASGGDQTSPVIKGSWLVFE